MSKDTDNVVRRSFHNADRLVRKSLTNADDLVRKSLQRISRCSRSGVHKTPSVLSRLEGMIDDLYDIEKETKRWSPVCQPWIVTKVVWGVLAGIIVATYSGYRISISENHFHDEQRSNVREFGQQVINSVSTQLETSVSSTRALAALIQVDAGVSLLHPLSDEVLRLQESTSLVAAGAKNETATLAASKSDIISKMHLAKFNKVASSLISSYKGITNLQMAPHGVVSVIHPLPGNEKAIGHDLFFDPNRREGAIKAIRARDVIFVGPLSLLQNGRTAVIARFPVFVNSTSFSGVWPEDRSWWGFATMLSEIDDLMKHTALATLSNSDQYAFVLYAKKGEKNILISASTSVPGQPEKATEDPETPWLNHASEQDPVTISLQIPDLNIDWVMQIWYKDGWATHGESYYLSIVLTAFGLLASAISVYGVALRNSVTLVVQNKSLKLVKVCQDAVLVDKEELARMKKQIEGLEGRLDSSQNLHEDQVTELYQAIEGLEECKLGNLITIEALQEELQFKKELATGESAISSRIDL